MDNAVYPAAESAGVPPVEGVAGGGTGYGWMDGSPALPGSIRGLDEVDPTKVPSSDLLHVWCMPSTANVGLQELPRPLEPISLLAARNERESVQVALRPKVSWGGPGIAGSVQIQCADLCSADGNRLEVGKCLTMRHVVPILGVPDALVPLDLPADQINLHPGETTAIWLSISIPFGQPPGHYEGEIFATAIKADIESKKLALAKSEKHRLHRELQNCIKMLEPLEGTSVEEVLERTKCASSTLKGILSMPMFADFSSAEAIADMMEEDSLNSLSVRVKLIVTVWDFVLPLTPSLPAVFGVSETVIEDRFGLEHGSNVWYDALDSHFRWLLQYRISPFFCRWGDSMRVLAYTCPWPADHPKSDEYYADPRLAAYAVPFAGLSGFEAKDALQREVEILRAKEHWKKAYFYLWDEPLNLDQYESIRNMSNEIRSYAPDARVLTTYYCGPRDALPSPSNFEAFIKVPNLLRPHTQIFCTSEWVLGTREDLAKDIMSELQPENGEEWWTYVCMGPTDPHPNWHLGMRGTQHRAVMWQVWKQGGTGFLYWGANCYERSTMAGAEIRFRRGLPPGDGVLFYPGEVFSSSHELVASVRLERLLSGLQDIEYLKLYASKYGRDEGLALLEKTGVYRGPEQYTLDHMPIDVMRAEIFSTCRIRGPSYV